MDAGPVETTIYSLSDEPPAAERRRDSERHMTLFRVGSITIGNCRELCLIKNISAGGMKIRAYSAMREGTAVSIELKCGQEIAGKAIWVDGSNVGIAFDRSVDVIELLSGSMGGPTPRMPRIEASAIASVGKTPRYQ